MNTETLDKLYLEISQFTKAKTADQIELESLLSRATVTHQQGSEALAATVLLIFDEDAHAQKMYEWLVRQGAMTYGPQ